MTPARRSSAPSAAAGSRGDGGRATGQTGGTVAGLWPGQESPRVHVALHPSSSLVDGGEEGEDWRPVRAEILRAVLSRGFLRRHPFGPPRRPSQAHSVVHGYDIEERTQFGVQKYVYMYFSCGSRPTTTEPTSVATLGPREKDGVSPGASVAVGVLINGFGLMESSMCHNHPRTISDGQRCKRASLANEDQPEPLSDWSCLKVL